MPKTVKSEQYLGAIGWKSCLDRYELRSRSLPDKRWGYWVLLRDVDEITRAEERYTKEHGELPRVTSRKPKKPSTKGAA